MEIFKKNCSLPRKEVPLGERGKKRTVGQRLLGSGEKRRKKTTRGALGQEGLSPGKGEDPAPGGPAAPAPAAPQPTGTAPLAQRWAVLLGPRARFPSGIVIWEGKKEGGNSRPQAPLAWPVTRPRHSGGASQVGPHGPPLPTPPTPGRSSTSHERSAYGTPDPPPRGREGGREFESIRQEAHP